MIMRKKIFLIVSLLTGFLLAQALTGYIYADPGEELRLYIGQPKILTVSHPSRIVIGNPEIVDVINVSKSEMTISPKAVGTTTLVYWDNLGEQSYQVKVFAEDMQVIKRRIDIILKELRLPGVYTQAVDEEAKVLLLGEVNTAGDRERVVSALGTLKEKIVDLVVVKEVESVVEIDVQVLELDKDATYTLGFTWPGSITLTDSSVPTTTAVTGLKRVFHVSDFTRSAFNITLDALVQEGKARVLSRPRLACQSGKEAELLVGGEKPILTTAVAATTGAQATEVDYKEYGIKLKIKPTVTEEEKIKLGLNVEVSEVGTAETIGGTTAPTAKAYPLTKRTTSTELYLDNGQTMAISGLIKEKTEEDIRKTPWLGDIPILGWAFRKKTTQLGGGTGARGNTELFITLTPTIVSGKKEARPEKKIKIEPSILSPPAKKTPTSPQSLQDYAKVIQRRILNNLDYPVSAKESGFQGRVELSLHLSYSGELLDVLVKSSSGYKILDNNAVSVAKRFVHYPPFPSSIDKKELWIDIPIEYRLD